MGIFDWMKKMRSGGEDERLFRQARDLRRDACSLCRTNAYYRKEKIRLGCPYYPYFKDYETGEADPAPPWCPLRNEGSD